MCGIVGIVAKNQVNQEIYDGLTMLQHRGQDAAGIITSEGNRLYLHKDNGLVRDVFSKDEYMIRLRGNMGIGHVRYPTAGTSTSAEAQPFYTNTPFGVALAAWDTADGQRTWLRRAGGDAALTDRLEAVLDKARERGAARPHPPHARGRFR